MLEEGKINSTDVAITSTRDLVPVHGPVLGNLRTWEHVQLAVFHSADCQTRNRKCKRAHHILVSGPAPVAPTPPSLCWCYYSYYVVLMSDRSTTATVCCLQAADRATARGARALRLLGGDPVAQDRFGEIVGWEQQQSCDPGSFCSDNTKVKISSVCIKR